MKLHGNKGGILQRKTCACGNPIVTNGMCADCNKKHEGQLQRSATNHEAVEDVPEIVYDVLRSPGQPLDDSTRGFMESRFGQDFSNVRVHTDGQAAESARAVNAHAYTVGQHIAFNDGQYTPQSTEGKRLLAHELTHTVQQGNKAHQVQRSSLIVDGDGFAEHEAQQTANAVVSGQGVQVNGLTSVASLQRQPKEPILTDDNAGGCGICFRGDMKAVGNSAHTQIQQEFEIMYPLLLTGLPIEMKKKTHIISKGVPDLILPTPTGFKVGEIKPANLEGYIEGGAKIEIYKRLFEEVFGKKNPALTVEPLDILPPPPMPFVEPASLACTQLLIVGPSVRGVYNYMCQPPFSYGLRQRCRCKGDRNPPVPVKKPEKVTEKEKEKVKEDEKKKVRDENPETKGKPVPPEILVPVGLAALLGLAAKWIGKKAAGRVMAPATVVAAIVLIANGAEASVGLEGDDALEAMFKMAEQKGTPIPDDLKDAIKKDPALKKILEDSKSGSKTEAQRKLGEQLTRVILENRDQFTEEELREMLQVSEQNRDVMPNGEITIELLRQTLDKKGKAHKGEGGTAKGEAATDSGTAPKPNDVRDATGNLQGPARRLMEALIQKGGKGPKVDADNLKRLQDILRNIQPPLTESETEELKKRVVAAEGKTIDEVINNIQSGLTELRAKKIKTDEAGNGNSTAAESAKKGGKSNETPGKVSTNTAVKKEKQGEKDPKTEALLEEKFGQISAGDTYIFGPKDLVFENGKSFIGQIIGRDTAKALFIGSGALTPRLVNGIWQIEVPAGIELHGAAGDYGKTLKFTAVAFAGASTSNKK